MHTDLFSCLLDRLALDMLVLNDACHPCGLACVGRKGCFALGIVPQGEVTLLNKHTDAL